MGQILILNANNTTAPINGKTYRVGDYGCNYPVRSDILGAETITAPLGERLITTSGGLLSILGNNTNKPVYPFLMSELGVIFEVDYVINDTSAMLVRKVTTDQLAISCYVLDTVSSPLIAQTLGSPTGLSYSNGVNMYNKYSKFIIDYSPSMVEEFGSDPVSIDFGTTGNLTILTINYR